jgi:hypothetical protein
MPPGNASFPRRKSAVRDNPGERRAGLGTYFGTPTRHVQVFIMIKSSSEGKSPDSMVANLDFMTRQCLEKRLKVRLVVSPSAGRPRMDGLANLREAG